MVQTPYAIMSLGCQRQGTSLIARCIFLLQKKFFFSVLIAICDMKIFYKGDITVYRVYNKLSINKVYTSFDSLFSVAFYLPCGLNSHFSTSYFISENVKTNITHFRGHEDKIRVWFTRKTTLSRQQRCYLYRKLRKNNGDIKENMCSSGKFLATFWQLLSCCVTESC